MGVVHGLGPQRRSRGFSPSAPTEGNRQGSRAIRSRFFDQCWSHQMMQYKGYMGHVEYDDEAKILHGCVLGILDVITFQADTARQIEKAFRDSVDDYLQFCAHRGEKPEKSYSGKLLLRMNPELHRALDMVAEIEGKSLNGAAVELLEKALATKG